MITAIVVLAVIAVGAVAAGLWFTRPGAARRPAAGGVAGPGAAPARPGPDPTRVQSTPDAPTDYTTWIVELTAAMHRGDRRVVEWATHQYVPCQYCGTVVATIDAWPDAPRQGDEPRWLRCPACRGAWMRY